MPGSPARKSQAKKTQRGRPFDADGSVTRAKIVNAARECFAQHGYADATNKLIASAAGVSASALYNYFPSKKDIYGAVLEQGEAYIASIYKETIANIDSPLKALISILDTNIRLHGELPELSPFYGHIRSEAARNPELAEYIESRHSETEIIFRDLIQKAQLAGEITDSIPAKNIEMMLFACILGLSVYGLQIEKEEHRKTMIAFKQLFEGSLINSKNTDR